MILDRLATAYLKAFTIAHLLNGTVIYIALFASAWHAVQQMCADQMRWLVPGRGAIRHIGAVGLLAASGIVLCCRNSATRGLNRLLESPTIGLDAKRLCQRRPSVCFPARTEIPGDCFYRFEIFHVVLPTIARHKSGLKAPAQDLSKLVLEIIIFGFALGLIVNSNIDRLMLALRVGAIQCVLAPIENWPPVPIENWPGGIAV